MASIKFKVKNENVASIEFKVKNENVASIKFKVKNENVASIKFKVKKENVASIEFKVKNENVASIEFKVKNENVASIKFKVKNENVASIKFKVKKENVASIEFKVKNENVASIDFKVKNENVASIEFKTPQQKYYYSAKREYWHGTLEPPSVLLLRLSLPLQPPGCRFLLLLAVLNRPGGGGGAAPHSSVQACGDLLHYWQQVCRYPTESWEVDGQYAILGKDVDDALQRRLAAKWRQAITTVRPPRRSLRPRPRGTAVAPSAPPGGEGEGDEGVLYAVHTRCVGIGRGFDLI